MNTTYEFIETDEDSWLMKLSKLPTTNTYNTIPEGESEITFLSEPKNDMGHYTYSKGKNKGERHHILIDAMLHLKNNTRNKVTEKSHDLGLSRSAFQSLYTYLKDNNKSLRLKGRQFICCNKHNKGYDWKELDEKA